MSPYFVGDLASLDDEGDVANDETAGARRESELADDLWQLVWPRGYVAATCAHRCSVVRRGRFGYVAVGATHGACWCVGDRAVERLRVASAGRLAICTGACSQPSVWPCGNDDAISLFETHA